MCRLQVGRAAAAQDRRRRALRAVTWPAAGGRRKTRKTGPLLRSRRFRPRRGGGRRIRPRRRQKFKLPNRAEIPSLDDGTRLKLKFKVNLSQVSYRPQARSTAAIHSARLRLSAGYHSVTSAFTPAAGVRRRPGPGLSAAERPSRTWSNLEAGSTGSLTGRPSESGSPSPCLSGRSNS